MSSLVQIEPWCCLMAGPAVNIKNVSQEIVEVGFGGPPGEDAQDKKQATEQPAWHGFKTLQPGQSIIFDFIPAEDGTQLSGCFCAYACLPIRCLRSAIILPFHQCCHCCGPYGFKVVGQSGAEEYYEYDVDGCKGQQVNRK